MAALDGPVLILNLKTYATGHGKAALDLARALGEVSAGFSSVTVGLACSSVDIHQLASQQELPILAQHVDPVGYGSNTGTVMPETAAEAGAIGTLVNHSERRLQLADIDDVITRCRTFGLLTVVCTNNVNTTRAAAALGPDFVAVEPPELIGGDISVSTAAPEVISGSVSAVRKIDSSVRVLCGAGVKTGTDVRSSLELGAGGVLLASGITKAADPASALEALLDGFAN